MVRIVFVVLACLAGSALRAQTTPPDCTITIANPSVNIGASAYSNAFNVSGTPSGCRWTAATNNPEWLTLSFGTSGTTSGIVGYTANANNSISARTGSIRVNNATFTVNQAAGVCSYSLSPTSTSPSASGSIGNVTVNTYAGCNWNAQTTVEWVTITGGTGTGPGNFSYSVAANPSTTGRTGTITVGTATFTINQQGGCGFTISPAAATVQAAGGSGTISVVATSSSCDANPTSTVSWITISGAGGVGSGNVNYTVAANNTAAQRTGTILIGNQTFTVTQLAANCTFTVEPKLITAGALGYTGTIRVTTTCAWTATTDTPWITITSGSSGTGSGNVSFTINVNSSPQQRQGGIIVGTVGVGVIQAGAGCNYTIEPATGTVAAGGGTGKIDVSTAPGCTWTAVASASWVTVSSGQSGSGEGTVVWVASPNTATTSRTATVAIGSQTFTLAQDGAACTFVLSAPGANVSNTAGTYTLDVVTPCAWTAASSVPWIAIPAGSVSGSGSATVTFTVAANTTGQTRTGTITIGGQSYAVTQSAVSCSYSVNPGALTLPGEGGSGQFRVTSGNGCSWTPAAADNWIRITSWSNVNGSGLVEFSVAYNNYLSTRSGTINIAGQTFTVSQGGAGPKVASNGVVNSGSYASGAVAPGEIVTIFGAGLGPETGVQLKLESLPEGTFVSRVLADTRVLFDDIPAAMIYSSAGQVSAVVPYALAGKATSTMKLEYLGVQSPGVSLNVAPAAPAIYTNDASGSGQGAILNQDYSANSAAKPAARNSVVMVFATGGGQTNPDGMDGRVTGTTLPVLRLPVTATIGGIAATVAYAGGAPGLVSGVVQINLRVPANAPQANNVPVVIRVGTAQTQANVTMVIR